VSLEIRNAWKTFAPRRGSQEQQVLRGVDLRVGGEELISLIGHSGCGKSTLLNLVAGLLDADQGEVLVDGAPVRGPGPDRSVVFQHYSLLPRLSLIANVREAARSTRTRSERGRADELSERYLRAVGLWDHRNKRPHEVSGGMQQRTAVARAFAVEPKILLLDEPFGALDALTRARLQQELIDLWQSESRTETVLMVTHGIEEAIFLADRIVVMGGPPGPSIVEEILVPLPRPRDRVAMIDDPAYHAVYERLMAVLTAQDTGVN
jgi:ABC-type nitrate/sulfonate/bicarbonate transport system ATPase subunit